MEQRPIVSFGFSNPTEPSPVVDQFLTDAFADRLAGRPYKLRDILSSPHTKLILSVVVQVAFDQHDRPYPEGAIILAPAYAEQAEVVLQEATDRVRGLHDELFPGRKKLKYTSFDCLRREESPTAAAYMLVADPEGVSGLLLRHQALSVRAAVMVLQAYLVQTPKP